MKTTQYVLTGSLVCAWSFAAVLLGGPPVDAPLAFQGEVMDSTCAQAGSHADMENAKGIANSRDCVLECLKDGSKLVLYDRATGAIHTLDIGGPIYNEDRLMEFAGAKVKIVGSIDENTGVIWHIQSVQRL
jgi:hypothetical protein